MTGRPATGVEPSPRSTWPVTLPCLTVTFVISTRCRIRSVSVVAPANGMFSLMKTFEFVRVLTASTRMLPTGIRATAKLPSGPLVAPNCTPSVMLVILTTVSRSGRRFSSSVRPLNVPRPSMTMSRLMRCPFRCSANWMSLNSSVSESTATMRFRFRSTKSHEKRPSASVVFWLMPRHGFPPQASRSGSECSRTGSACHRG